MVLRSQPTTPDVREINRGRHKPVRTLRCLVCQTVLSYRGMRAHLIHSGAILHSSDTLLTDSISVINDPLTTSECDCVIRDIACRLCGHVVGYTVCVPCDRCLSAGHNGHLNMYVGVSSTRRPGLLWQDINNANCPEGDTCLPDR